jgi:5,10-methylenetetrahydromethanopterin reductase
MSLPAAEDRVRCSLDFAHQSWTRATDGIDVARRTIELARKADAAGVDLISVSEDPDGWDAFGVLGAIAVSTNNAALATSVASPYLRDPNLIAASVATLDRLSRGRAVLGLGRGQPEWFERSLGKMIGSPLVALEETITLLRQWWTPGHVATSSAGDQFQIKGWERSIHPVQALPPIYLAAAGPKAIALAGRMADGVIFNNLTSDEALTALIGDARAAATAAGRDSGRLAILLRTHVMVMADPEPWLERQKNALAIINTLPGMDRLVQTPDYDVAAIMRDLRRVMRTDEALRDAGGFSTLRRYADFAAARALVPTGLMARLAIAGPLAQVRERLRRLAEIGVTHVSLPPPDDLYARDEEEIASLLRELRSA